MNPQDKVERVLKEIHVAFSKSPTYNGQPDKIIIDRKQFLGLLDRLNNGIYDMMEQYEQTRQSRQNAERAFRRKGDEIIEQANSSADDIYAASVIYTADAIGKIRDLMDQTNDSMNDLFRQFRKDLREQKDLLKSHESELQAQLADLADTKKYLSMIEEMNRERERKNRDLEAEKEVGNQYARSMFHTSMPAADIKVNEAYFEKSGKTAPEERIMETAAAVEKPDIRINTNAAYFKWKAKQNAQSGEEQPQDEPDLSVSAAETAGSGGQAAEGEPGGSHEGMAAGAELNGRSRTETSAPVEDANRPEDDGTEYPNPDFPDEAAILRAVQEDERRAMEDELDEAAHRSKAGTGRILKNIFFGKD